MVLIMMNDVSFKFSINAAVNCNLFLSTVMYKLKKRELPSGSIVFRYNETD